MKFILNHPLLIFLLSTVVLGLSARVGTMLRKRYQSRVADELEDLNVIVPATLTLFALIIGFSFSMAISRYDQRKNYEEAEANAIGTEYVRADVLPPANAQRVRTLLKGYVDQRILFYTTRDEAKLQQIDAATAQLQADLWSQIQAPATVQPTPVIALAVAGMNDVLNSQGYTQAAWWNRIPTEAWFLMAAMGICSNLLLGYGRRAQQPDGLFLIFPLLVSISFFIIADIESPRGGLIVVRPQNLEMVARSLPAH